MAYGVGGGGEEQRIVASLAAHTVVSTREFKGWAIVFDRLSIGDRPALSFARPLASPQAEPLSSVKSVWKLGSDCTTGTTIERVLLCSLLYLFGIHSIVIAVGRVRG